MIKNWDYRSEYEDDRDSILQIVDRVFSSGRLILGPSVSRFEENFAAFCGRRYGIGVNSGTDALFLALKTLEIGIGDEVITVSNTAVPTVAAIRAAGAAPVFIDVEEDTFLMNARLLEAAITKRTRCILPVHLFGQMADMDAVAAIARDRNVAVVEDCAQAAGASYKGRKAGSFGAVAAFSFYPTKILGGYGDGGMVVTEREDLNRKLRRLRFYGMDTGYYSEEEGYNSRLDELHAAILDFKLQSLDQAAAKRRRIAEVYDQGLAGIGDIRLPAVSTGRTHQYYLYTIQTDHRDGLQRYLQEQGIETRINYPVPIHLMRGYDFLGYHRGDLPVVEKLAERILSLPLHPGLPLQHVEFVIDRIKRFFSMQRP